MRKITCRGKNARLLTHALRYCGDTLQEVHVICKTPIGIATMLDQIRNLNPGALKHLQFHEAAHLDDLTFTLAQRKSDEPLFSRIVGLRTCYYSINLAKLISHAMRGIQGLQKITVHSFHTDEEHIRSFLMLIGNQDSLSHYQISHSELREMKRHQGRYLNTMEFDITWKSNAELSQKNPSEAFKMFVQGLRGIKKVDHEV